MKKHITRKRTKSPNNDCSKDPSILTYSSSKSSSCIEFKPNEGLRTSIVFHDDNNNPPNHHKSSHLLAVPPPFDVNCLSTPKIQNEETKETKEIKNTTPLILEIAHAVFCPPSVSKRQQNAVQPTPIQLQSWSIYSSPSCPLSQNLIGISPTGSGKTLCYSIPILTSLLQLHFHQQSTGQKQKEVLSAKVNDAKDEEGEKVKKHRKSKGGGVYAVVMVPTRELTLQVRKEIQLVITASRRLMHEKKEGHFLGDDDVVDDVDSLAIYGGVCRKEQVNALLSKNLNISDVREKKKKKKKKWWIVVATPGRLLDLISVPNDCDSHTNEKGINLDSAQQIKSRKVQTRRNGDDKRVKRLMKMFTKVQHMVIDEADRIAGNSDMASQVDRILKILKQKDNGCPSTFETTSLYSATLPQRILEKWNEWISFPRVVIEVDSVTVGGREGTEKENSSGDNTKNVHLLEGEVTSVTKKEQKTQDVIEADLVASLPNENKNLASAKRETAVVNISTIPKHLIQTLHVCSNHKKPKKLLTTLSKIRKQDQSSLITRRNKSLTIIFFGRIKTLHYVSSFLMKEKISCVALHSQMSQSKREQMLMNFRSGKCPILLATDIAARGLHVNNVMYVINYDFPTSVEQVWIKT